MKTIIYTPLFILLTAIYALAAPTVTVPANIDHKPYDELLQKYVDKEGLVDYAGWKKNAADSKKFDDYLQQFEPVAQGKTPFDEEVASLINAYNAFTIKWILDNYPVESIRKTKKPWKADRWTIGGKKISLDAIEHKNLRPMIGWKVHSAVVCAAISCPPLRNVAYTAENYNDLIDEAYVDWLKEPKFNQYLPDKKQVKLSKIFDWYGGDYKDAYSIKNILIKYAPEKHQKFLKSKKYKIKYLKYDWALNKQ